MLTYFGEIVPPKPDWVKYVIYQLEQCPSTKKDHYQMYAEFSDKVTIKKIHEWLPGCHVENRYGKQSDAIRYCSKEESRVEGPWEQGNKNNMGERNDLEDSYKLVMENATKKNPAKVAVEEHTGTFIRYGKNIMDTAAQVIEPRDYKPYVKVYHGSTGTGKSRLAHEELPDAFVWTPTLGKWWGNYFAQEDIIIEEFRGQLTLGDMLMLLDRYEHTVEVKGGFRTFRGRNIIICSPKHPSEWYLNQSDDRIDQLLRRIDEVVCTDDISKK